MTGNTFGMMTKQFCVGIECRATMAVYTVLNRLEQMLEQKFSNAIIAKLIITTHVILRCIDDIYFNLNGVD